MERRVTRLLLIDYTQNVPRKREISFELIIRHSCLPKDVDRREINKKKKLVKSMVIVEQSGRPNHDVRILMGQPRTVRFSDLTLIRHFRTCPLASPLSTIRGTYISQFSKLPDIDISRLVQKKNSRLLIE